MEVLGHSYAPAMSTEGWVKLSWHPEITFWKETERKLSICNQSAGGLSACIDDGYSWEWAGVQGTSLWKMVQLSECRLLAGRAVGALWTHRDFGRTYALVLGRVGCQGEGRSPASPNSHQMVFVIQRQHFFNLYNGFWHAVHSVRWRHGFVSVQRCFSCSSQPSLVTAVGGSITQSQRYLWDDQGGLLILSYAFSLAFQWMEAGLPGLSGQCVTADAGEAFRSVRGPAPILPHSTVVPSARARAFRK